MQSMKPSALPTSEASYGTGPSRSGRALRLVPLLGLLAGAFIGYAALFGAGDAAGGPSELKLDIGKPFVQGILALLKMKVDQVTLNKPPSRWAQSALGIISFDLVMDLHMEMLFFGAQATLGSAEMTLIFEGETFGTLNTAPCPLGGGGKIVTQMAGNLVIDDNAVFQKVAKAVIDDKEFTVELYAVLAVELRGGDNGCLLKKAMCATVGSMRIPGITFAQSVTLRGAQGFSISMSPLVLTDLPSPEPAGKALIKIEAQVFNPSSFVLRDLDVMSLNIYTDDSWPKTEKPAIDSLGVKFVEVNTEPGFWLPRGQSEKFKVEGFLSVPEREYDLVKTADVFNHFLTSRPTPLIPYIAGASQPFFSTAARGAALRAFLPGITPGDNNIIQKVYINLNIPVAIATLLNPLNEGRLQQYLQIELKNPLDSTLYLLGLVVEILYKGVHVGQVDLPVLEPDMRIVIPPSATFRTAKSYPVELFGKDLAYVIMLLKDLAPVGCEAGVDGCGLASVDLNARLRVRIGGVEPILVYKQYNVSVML